MKRETPIKLHIKNNYWETPESQEIFTITPERYAEAAKRHADIAGLIDPTFGWDLENFENSMKTAEVLIGWDFPTDRLAERAPELRVIHIIGAGVEHLHPIDWVPERVTLVNNKGAHASKAGEFGLMAVLMLHNHVPALMRNQRKRLWRSLYSTPIAGKTLLVIGVGNIGSAVARKAKSLGMRVLGVSRHGVPIDGVDEIGTPVDLDTMLPCADFVFVSTPLTPETRNLLDRRRLALLKPGAGVVNVGRAAVIDYAALSALLDDGQLGGAVLDVFDPEPLPASSPLWDVKNLLVTPHVSADDGDSYIQITLDLFFNNMRRYLAGHPLQNIVRADLGY